MSGTMVAAVNEVNTVNTVNSLNIVNIVDFNAMRYKKHYNDSTQVFLSRQTVNFIERDNFLAIIFRTVRVGTINFFEIFSA